MADPAPAPSSTTESGGGGDVEMSYLSLKPTFPQDVERHIFEVAAGMDVKTAMALVALSKIVNVWIESFFYKNIILLSASKGGKQLEKLMKTVDKSKPSNFLSTHVKTVYLSAGFSNRDLLVEFLMKCGGSLEHFANYRLTHDVPSKKRPELIRDLVSGGNLTRFSGYLAPLWSAEKKPDFSNEKMFKNLTHLFVADSWEVWSTWDWELFVEDTKLTYLALPIFPHLKDGVDDYDAKWGGEKKMVGVVSKILERLGGGLGVLVIVVDCVLKGKTVRRWKDGVDDEAVRRIGGGDPRVVGLEGRVDTKDWDVRINEVWDEAKRKVERQKRDLAAMEV